MKLNFKVFKSKPVWYILGGLVAFYVFYRIASGGSSGITTVNSGPSDAAVQASTALQMANLQYGAQTTQMQTQANAAVAIEQLHANSANYQTQASVDLGKYTAALDAQTQAAYMTVQQNIAALNAQYSLDTAKVAAETNIAQWGIMANVMNTQTVANAAVQSQFIQASTFQALAATIPSLKERDRSIGLGELTSAMTGQAYHFYEPGGWNINTAPTGSTGAFQTIDYSKMLQPINTSQFLL